MADIKELFALTEEEALRRYGTYKSRDPFSDIPAALLSSAHIQAYIAKTGMVFPYFPADNPEEERITSASLIMTIGPEVLYWEPRKSVFSYEDRRRYYNNLEEGDAITLRQNSITFLRPAERFNLPDYIAARFNLRIKYVHRGLLLGTGPLIDPGFKGYPMIPVHNLTENEYEVHVGDKFINVEFTKISDINIEGKGLEADYNFEYLQNRGKAFDYTFTKYIDKNVPQKKVKSSLSSVIDEAKKVVEKQKKILWWSFIAGLVAIAGLILGGYMLTLSATEIINAARERIDQQKELETKVLNLQKSLLKLQEKITGLSSGTVTIKNTHGIINQSRDSESGLINKEIQSNKGKNVVEKVDTEGRKINPGDENKNSSK